MPPAFSSEWTGLFEAPSRRPAPARDRLARLVQRATGAMLHLEAGRRRRVAATSWNLALWLVPALLLIVTSVDFCTGAQVEAGFFYALPILVACLLLGRWGALLVPVCLALFHLNEMADGTVVLTVAGEHGTRTLVTSLLVQHLANDLLKLGTFSTVAALTLLARLFYLDLAVAGQDLLVKRRELEREMALAARLQACLYNIPAEGYRHGGLEVHARCRPLGAVGGDLCHLILDDDGVRLFVGDVIGKGVPAALVMSMCTVILARSGDPICSPGRALAECNRLLSHHFDQDPEPVVTATAFFGAIRAGELVFSLAGHEAPILLSERQVEEEPPRGLLMGAFDEAAYPEVRVLFGAGEKLVVFTDGAVEIRNGAGEEFGRKRLQAAAQRWRHLDARELLEQLLAEIDAFAGGVLPRDDLALVVVAREG
jgi:sigma-B regulation protein RsbU (phosphoserine phosphatase)